MKRHPFNLIELMLALGVIVIGLVSVLALFPIGANANRDAAAENYASQAAEQTLSLMAKYITTSDANWVTFVSGGSPLITDCSTPSNFANYIATWHDQDGHVDDYLTPSPLNVGAVKTIYQRNASKFDEGLLIRNGHTNGAGEYITDFEALAFVWQQKIVIDPSASPPLEIDLKYATCLNIEISWPARLPYARRQKATYRLEVFNPNL
jgi:type II secretory pathway pseudopilin PulG